MNPKTLIKRNSVYSRAKGLIRKSTAYSWVKDPDKFIEYIGYEGGIYMPLICNNSYIKLDGIRVQNNIITVITGDGKAKSLLDRYPFLTVIGSDKLGLHKSFNTLFHDIERRGVRIYTVGRSRLDNYTGKPFKLGYLVDTTIEEKDNYHLHPCDIVAINLDLVPKPDDLDCVYNEYNAWVSTGKIRETDYSGCDKDYDLVMDLLRESSYNAFLWEVHCRFNKLYEKISKLGIEAYLSAIRHSTDKETLELKSLCKKERRI